MEEAEPMTMSKRVQIPVPLRARRSQIERTAETRERIMAAVVESIGEIGYPKTTATEIARRAGVSWGAVQHHFGDKEGILVAVLEESFNRFADVLTGPIEADLALASRVSVFVDRSWIHFGSAHYRSTYEILINLPPGLAPAWQSEVLATWMRIWSDFFPERSRPERRTVHIMRYTVSVLSGLATMNMLEGAPTRGRRTELAYLKDTLTRELAGHGA
jgi:AcrR family transcriptional regulator